MKILGAIYLGPMFHEVTYFLTLNSLEAETGGSPTTRTIWATRSPCLKKLKHKKEKWSRWADVQQTVIMRGLFSNFPTKLGYCCTFFKKS